MFACMLLYVITQSMDLESIHNAASLNLEPKHIYCKTQIEKPLTGFLDRQYFLS